MTDQERPRLRKFYEKLAYLIPCQTDDARAELLAMSPADLLVRYFNWADRRISPRSRRIVTWEGISRHGSALSCWEAVKGLAAEIEAGNDLMPFLSDKVHKCGYVSAKQEGRRSRGVEWADKDYALNAFEMHHLHLSRSGSERLLYVSFSRTDAFFLMVGDHKSFDDGSLARAVAESRVGTSYELKGAIAPREQPTMGEQNQIQRRGYTTFYPTSEGGSVVGATLSAAGTSPLHSVQTKRVIRTIERLEADIDKPSFGREWFEKSERTYPDLPDFEWAMDHCDLCLLENKALVKIPLVLWRR